MTTRIWYDPVKYPYQFQEPPKGTQERSGWGRCWNLQCTTAGGGEVGWYPTHQRVPVYLNPLDAMSKRYVCSTRCKEEVEVVRKQKTKAAEVFGEDAVQPEEVVAAPETETTPEVLVENDGGVESNDALDERRSDEEKVGETDTGEADRVTEPATPSVEGEGDSEAIFNECKIGPTDTAPHLTRNDTAPPKEKTLCGRVVLEVTSGPVRGFQSDKRCGVCKPIAARIIKKSFGRDE